MNSKKHSLLLAAALAVSLTGCGSSSEDQTPELEELYQDLQKRNINLSPSPDESFYQEFTSDLSTFPTTYVVDSAGNIIGAPIVGNVKKQLDTLEARLDLILESSNT